MFSALKKLQSSGLTREELEAKVTALKLPQPLAFLSSISTTILIPLIWIVPFMAASLPVVFAQNDVQKIIFIGLAPVFFAIIFVIMAGLISNIGRPGVVAGKFPRVSEHPVYALRRIYGAAWTQLFYFKPLYAVCLGIPALKGLMLRLYGYRGDLGVTVFPDTWIRDLPLLKVGKGVYIANRATLGTNMCLTDGSILVGSMQLDDNALIGHMVLIALGSKVGKGSELGINAAGGIRIQLGEKVSARPRCNLNHGCVIGDKTIIGTAALVGLKAKIGSNIEIRSGASIPPGAIVNTQADADAYFSAETQVLNDERDSILDKIHMASNHGITVRNR